MAVSIALSMAKKLFNSRVDAIGADNAQKGTTKETL
jgi:hypothetical protein